MRKLLRFAHTHCTYYTIRVHGSCLPDDACTINAETVIEFNTISVRQSRLLIAIVHVTQFNNNNN